MNAADVLEGAANMIESRGWWHDEGGLGESDKDPNSICAGLATSLFAHGGRPFGDRIPAVLEADSALCAFIGLDQRMTAIYEWNDAPGQTKENVIATMRACAAIWRAKQENTDSRSAVPALGVESELAQ